jgi:DNA-binding IclR family transcriptional regulator
MMPDRAISIVELLAKNASGLPLSEISDGLGIPRSATHRLLADLREEGYVRQDYEGGIYRLTAKIVALGFAYLDAAGATRQIQPLLDRLAEKTGELITLAVIDTGSLIRVARVQGARRGLRYNPDESSEVYLAATSNGIAWLSCLSEEEGLQLVARQGFNRDGYGPKAPKTIRELTEQVEVARRLGYARIFDTYEAGTSAIAAPICRPETRQAIGTLSVAGPSVRMTGEAMDRIAPDLLACAAEIAVVGAHSPLFEQVRSKSIVNV